MRYRPESTNIDWGGAEVNIGILRSISHRIQCLNSQQSFFYIISLNKKSNNNNNIILAIDYVLDSLEFLFFTWWLTDFIQFKEEWMHTQFVITTADRENPDEMTHNVAFHQGLHCLRRQKWSSGKKLQFCLEINTCDLLNFTMGYSKFIASIQKEEFISAFKSSANYYI